MTFPNANSRIYRNEEGEVLGWDTWTEDAPEYCDECGGHCPAGRCRNDEEDDDTES